MNDRRNSASTPGDISLWFGILTAPLAWSLQHLLSYIVSSYDCSARAAVPADAHVYALSAPYLIITAATLALALWGGWVAVKNWRAMRGKPRGLHLDLDEIDPERKRFFARLGVFNSGIFVAAFFFTVAELLLEPLCGK
jgi:hypothetical protein